MTEERKEEPQIHIETIHVPEEGKKLYKVHSVTGAGKHTKAVWVIASVVFGTSLMYMLIDISSKGIALLTEKREAEQKILAETAQQKPMGSDDEVEEVSIQNYAELKGTYVFKDGAPALPRTSSLSFLLGDVITGEVIVQKNESLNFPIASVSKLITAIVAKENIPQHDSVTVKRSSVETYGTQGGLYSGEKILATDLIYPLLIESSNDAAEVLAEYYGRDEFLKKMNARALEIGMKDTHFSDPSGLTRKNTSNILDLFTLAKYIEKEKPEIWDVTRVKQYAILKHSWINGNALMKKTNFLGGKNGYTEEASRTTVSVFEVPFQIEGKKEKTKRKIALVILKSNDRNGDADKLLRYIEQNVLFREEASEESLD